MKKVKNIKLVKVMVLEEADFEKIVQCIWGKEYEMDYSSCNVYIQNDKYSLDNDEVFPKLCQYFDVSHIDEIWYIEETRTVWIAYEEEK